MQDNILAVALLAALGVLTYLYVRAKKNEELLKQDALKKAFQEKISSLNEKDLLSDKEIKEAVSRFRAAVSQPPTDTKH